MSNQINAAELQALIANRMGSSAWFRGFLGIHFTEGMRDVAEAAGAYWLIDLISSHRRRYASEDFVKVELSVTKNSTATVRGTDGGKYGMEPRRLFAQRIPYTDFPAGKWTFYVERGANGFCVMLPSER